MAASEEESDATMASTTSTDLPTGSAETATGGGAGGGSSSTASLSDRRRMELLQLMSKAEKEEPGDSVESWKRKHLRFVMELEFVEMLANPRYLGYLSQQGYFEDERLMDYLLYLRYWLDRPEYTARITHVHALTFLHSLTAHLVMTDTDEREQATRKHKQFVKLLKDPRFIEKLCASQTAHWQVFKTNRHASIDTSKTH